MSWQAELDELARRKAMALEMGGEAKLARQKARSKLNARERLEALLDFDGFDEIGALAGKGEYTPDGELIRSSASNFIFGRGRINGRTIVATADDFTVRGGAADASVHRKFMLAEQMANELRLPIIRMIDGTGGGGSIKMLEDLGHTYVPYVPGWGTIAANLKTVPVVSLALGPTAGLGAARVVASHYSVMVKGLSQVFTAGPQVVAALGENQDKESLGGSHIHTRNGTVDDEVADEAEAFARARTFLSYLPDRAGGELIKTKAKKPKDKGIDLLSIVPRDKTKAYNMRRVLRALVDGDSLFEMGCHWGRASITAFARIDGWPVAVLANDPTFLGGSWTADAAEKTQRFVELANLFRLPVINLVDSPGFMIGLEAEKTGTIRRGVNAMNAVYASQSPWATMIIRKAYGVAGSAMSNAERFPYRVAWPSGDWGSLPIDGGVEVAYRSELEAAEDPNAELAKIKARLDNVTSPFRTAEAFGIEDIIDPRETRKWLVDFMRLMMRDSA
jgi:propionyl-CoA carboxylase beta chain